MLYTCFLNAFIAIFLALAIVLSFFWFFKSQITKKELVPTDFDLPILISAVLSFMCAFILTSNTTVISNIASQEQIAAAEDCQLKGDNYIGHEFCDVEYVYHTYDGLQIYEVANEVKTEENFELNGLYKVTKEEHLSSSILSGIIEKLTKDQSYYVYYY